MLKLFVIYWQSLKLVEIVILDEEIEIEYI